VGGPKSRGVIAVAQAQLMPASASASVSATTRRGQHVGGAAGHGHGLARCPARRRGAAHQHQVGEAHHLHRARRRAHVAGVAGLHEHEAGRVGRGVGRGHGGGAAPVKSGFPVALSPPALCHLSTAARPHVASAAPHAQHRHQGGPRGGGDHQPRRARPRGAAGRPQGPERLRLRGRPRGRAGHHRDLLEAYPGHGILAEESGRAHGAKDSEYVWIIDPLDGTTNFLHGFPVYAVSIALAHRGQVQQAVVYDPTRNDLFFASKGRGAFLNDRRLRVSKRTRIADALIGTGFPFRKGDNFKRYVKMFEEVMQHCAGLRRPGAASLDLCYVAAGWYDGFFETGLSPWDVAAGSLMITEAGGLIGNFTGEADFLYQRELVAGNPRSMGSWCRCWHRTRASSAEPPKRAPLRVRKAGVRKTDEAPF
jgi:fructose-1,6-bisphosphatase/inositol monophosphatase family enzyme